MSNMAHTMMSQGRWPAAVGCRDLKGNFSKDTVGSYQLKARVCAQSLQASFAIFSFAGDMRVWGTGLREV